MLFGNSRSALVRLSDCVKLDLHSCATTTTQILGLYEKHEFSFRRARKIAMRAKKREITDEAAASEIEKILQSVPADVADEGVRLQGILHSRALSSILISCFLIESYANSYAHYLLGDGSVTEEQKSKLTSSFGKGEKTRTQEKWAILGAIDGRAFNRAKSPFQDFVVLFHFRDDIVHDKPVQWGVNRVERYSGRMADPVLGHLALKDALFAADTYWALVNELHQLTHSAQEFHGHYNLKPWIDEEHHQNFLALAAQYARMGFQGR